MALFVFLLLRTADLENRVTDLQDHLDRADHQASAALDKANEALNLTALIEQEAKIARNASRAAQLQVKQVLVAIMTLKSSIAEISAAGQRAFERATRALGQATSVSASLANVTLVAEAVSRRVGQLTANVTDVRSVSQEASTIAANALDQANNVNVSVTRVAQAVANAASLADEAGRRVASVNKSLGALGKLLPNEDFEILVGTGSKFHGSSGLQDAINYLKGRVFARQVTIKVESGNYKSTHIPDFPWVNLVVITGAAGMDSVLDLTGARDGITFDSQGSPLVRDITLKSEAENKLTFCIHSNTLGASLRLENVNCHGWTQAITVNSGAQVHATDLYVAHMRNRDEDKTIYAATEAVVTLKNLYFNKRPGTKDRPCVITANVHGFIWWTRDDDSSTSGDACEMSCTGPGAYILAQAGGGPKNC